MSIARVVAVGLVGDAEQRQRHAGAGVLAPSIAASLAGWYSACSAVQVAQDDLQRHQHISSFSAMRQHQPASAAARRRRSSQAATPSTTKPVVM